MVFADDKDAEHAMKLRLLDTSDLQPGDVYNFGNRLQTGFGTSSKWCFIHAVTNLINTKAVLQLYRVTRHGP